MKIKHNKYKNTGILFELLVRKITADTLSSGNSKAAALVKKYFTKSELANENKLYQTINNSISLSEGKAETILSTVLDQSKKLDGEKLAKEKYNLIREIKENFDMNDFFGAKIKSYKLLASTYVLLESYSDKKFANPESIITSKITILEHITSHPDTKMSLSPLVEELMSLDKGTRALTYKIMLEKYNTKFDGLSTEQKEVLKEYIHSASDAPKLKEFLNTKFKGISAVLKENVGKIEEPALKIKIQEVINLIDPILETRKMKDDHLVALLQYLDLSKEITTV
jgi:hypothetical protein|tara:strand:+ start:1938 stop:2786 length:849 start_codon:yes stop_codon:yes gene_type:complete